MKILLIRHGEPDYELDCLTERGREQAQQLGQRLASQELEGAFSSPMGRARETARIALKGRDVQIEVLDWLHEFDVKVRDGDRLVQVWDIRPENWTNSPELYDRDRFLQHPDMEGTGIKERWEAVEAGVDGLLERYGLVREGGAYRKVRDFQGTIALFCHFGASCAVIARLLGITPVVALQGFSAEPTAIATVCTDDRFGDVVNFRVHGFGDISHLEDWTGGGVNYR